MDDYNKGKFNAINPQSTLAQGSMDHQVRGPTGPNWSKIFKFLLVLVRFWSMNSCSDSPLRHPDGFLVSFKLNR